MIGNRSSLQSRVSKIKRVSECISYPALFIVQFRFKHAVFCGLPLFIEMLKEIAQQPIISSVTIEERTTDNRTAIVVTVVVRCFAPEEIVPSDFFVKKFPN